MTYLPPPPPPVPPGAGGPERSPRPRWVVPVVVVLLLALGVGGGASAALLVGDDDPAPAGASGPDAGPTGPGSDGSDPAEGTDPAEPAPGAGVVPAGLEVFYTQQLDWQPCPSGDGNDCAVLTVPVDYDEPGGETVGIALERARATDPAQRVGSLIVNPGGPGAGGTSMAEDAEFYFTEALRARMDIIGFDPRGTGDSDPVDCISDEQLDQFVAADPTPDDAAAAQQLATGQEDFFAGCVANSDAVVGHVSTVEVARDMDVLRSVLGEEKMLYLGFSYGTTLGSTYAELFPANVGRVVLDGATDPTLGPIENSLSQAAGFQTALESYVGACVDAGDCFLGDTVEEGLTTIEDLIARIDDEPLPTSSGRELTIGNAFYGIVTPLYAQENWPFLDQALQEALDGQGDTLLFLSDTYGSRDPAGGYTDNSIEANLSINCLDDPTAFTPEEVPARLPEFEKASRTFGEVFAWGLMGCLGLQVESEFPAPTIRAEGAAPIVVIGTTRDPATPYQEAVALAEQLESGVLVSRDGDGHTGYNQGNACVDDAVEGYLLDGVVPDDGLEC
ncbi:alpha/beta hydrolase [Nocardioides sp.]|uniref:alpha/beta hydrolase n=1 Tax=Nocardioides sp. TaxID=35761 RepID=UPI003518FB4C